MMIVKDVTPLSKKRYLIEVDEYELSLLLSAVEQLSSYGVSTRFAAIRDMGIALRSPQKVS